VPAVKSPFSVTSSRHRWKIPLSRPFGGRVPPPPLAQSCVARVMFALSAGDVHPVGFGFAAPPDGGRASFGASRRGGGGQSVTLAT
jgi:hypothetical protein